MSGAGRPPAAVADPRPPIRILVVCTGNSARSILAQAMLRQLGGPAVEAHSAGIRPRGIHPLTLRVLDEANVPTDGLRSKSVDEYRGQRFDYVITVCDDAREACPVFPGDGRSLHWGYPDPVAAEGGEGGRLAAFRVVLAALGDRIRELLAEIERDATRGQPADRAGTGAGAR